MQHFFKLFKAFSLYSAKIPKLTPLNLLSEGLQMRPYHNNLAFVLSATPEDGAWRGLKSAYRPPIGSPTTGRGARQRDYPHRQ